MNHLKNAIEYKDKIKNYIDSESDFVFNLKSTSASIGNIKRKVWYGMSVKLLESTKTILEDGNIRAVTLAADLRGTLEIIIMAKLCKADQRFFTALAACFYDRDISFVMSMKAAIEKSTSRLELFYIQDKKMVENQIHKKMPIVGLGLDDLEFAGASGLYDLDAISQNGFGFQAHLVKQKILPRYIEEIERIKKEKEQFLENLLNEDFFKNDFPNIKDTKSASKMINDYLKKEKIEKWEDKAKKVNLSDEYNCVYKITSDVLHMTSYSIFTKSYLSNDEKEFYIRMFHNYLKEFVKIVIEEK